MDIINQRINVKAVKEYQTVEMEMTISNATQDEVAQVKEYLLNEAKIAVEKLAKDIGGTTTKPVQQSFQRSQPQPSYQAPRVNNPVQNQGFASQPQYQSRGPKPISEAQVKFINNLGFTGPLPQTFQEADELLKQLKAQRGIK